MIDPAPEATLQPDARLAIDPVSERQSRICPVFAVLSGTSGAGKDSVMLALAAIGHDFFRVVTVTTRKMRDGEVDGVDYHFRDRDQFLAMAARDEFLERATVYGEGKLYGTLRSPIEDALAAGRDILLRIDVQGARTIRETVPGAVLIFLDSDGPADQQARLEERGTDPPDVIATRLATAAVERQSLALFDYLVINKRGALDTTARTVQSILIAERNRVQPRQVMLPD